MSRYSIRRDGTFEYNGVRYAVRKGSDRPERDGERWVVRINSDEPGDETMVASGFGYLSEVRDWIERAHVGAWPDLDEKHQARDWWPEVRTWTEHPDRKTALNEERRQILEDAPRYNQAVYWTIGGKTKIRGFRVTDELWEDAQRVAKARGEDVSAEVRAGLERYVKRNRDLLRGPNLD